MYVALFMRAFCKKVIKVLRKFKKLSKKEGRGSKKSVEDEFVEYRYL